MNVMILSSSKEEVDNYYKEIARNISSYLAKNNFDLVYGASSKSMMGICYNEFSNYNKIVHAFTTNKYIKDLDNLKNAKHYINETTFDMKKSMFEISDLIVVLPGGIGTLSEVLSFIEENRSNDKNVPIIIYDEDNFYCKLFDLIEEMSNKNFITENIKEYISIAHNYDDFKEIINSYIRRGE